LDEISDVSPAFQVRLLRVLQDKTFQPLGATKTIKADVRVIAATNKSLESLVEKGQFRQDLYYRVNVVKLDLPPLRERKEDIPILVKHLVSRLNRLQGKAVTGISPKALALLMAHDYPGNVRELENIIEHAFVLCPQGEIDSNALPHGLVDLIPPAPTHHTMGAAKKAFETQIILDALKRSNYNRVAAARDLGLHKSTLFRKIKDLEIDLPSRDGRARQRTK
jgi:transcriptional regulator with PAS, ATPase and Fis domain